MVLDGDAYVFMVLGESSLQTPVILIRQFYSFDSMVCLGDIGHVSKHGPRSIA